MKFKICVLTILYGAAFVDVLRVKKDSVGWAYIAINNHDIF